MISKDIRKLVRDLKKQGFVVENGSKYQTLIAPNGARTHLPSGNDNRMGVTFVRKFAAKNGGRV